MQAVVGTIQMEAFLVLSIVNDDIEAAGHSDEKLVAFPQSVTSTISAARDVIQVKHALDLKRDMTVAFEEGQIATRIVYLRQFDYPTLIQFQVHRMAFSCSGFQNTNSGSISRRESHWRSPQFTIFSARLPIRALVARQCAPAATNGREQAANPSFPAKNEPNPPARRRLFAPNARRGFGENRACDSAKAPADSWTRSSRGVQSNQVYQRQFDRRQQSRKG